MAYQKDPRDEEIRFTNIPPGRENEMYRRNAQGQVIERIDNKKIEREKNITEARERILSNPLFLLKVSPTKNGVSEVLSWQDEDGEGIRNDDFILRTKDGEGDIVVYVRNFESENYKETELHVRELKRDYGIMNDFDYYDVRPIQFDNWSALPLKRKLASKTERKVTKKIVQPDIIGKHD